jgi:outer membrane lipoprotein-sorting protein
MQNLQILAYIDKATGRTRQMRMSGMMSGPQGQSQPMNINMIIQNEQVNVPIPDSVFKFTPPAGAKEMKGGMGMPGPGMGPGGGRR